MQLTNEGLKEVKEKTQRREVHEIEEDKREIAMRGVIAWS